jgi:hypothetical protein
MIGTAGYQHFSDDNERKHARFKAVFQPDLDLGLTFQYRYRYYNSSPNETRRAYFNPERYQENMLLAGWRYRSSGWVTSVLAGAGSQTVADAPRGPSRLFEVGVDSPLEDRRCWRCGPVTCAPQRLAGRITGTSTSRLIGLCASRRGGKAHGRCPRDYNVRSRTDHPAPWPASHASWFLTSRTTSASMAMTVSRCFVTARITLPT